MMKNEEDLGKRHEALIEQLEKAEVGSWALDASIHRWRFRSGEPMTFRDDDPQPYTTSIDAALTLVPPGDWNACFTTYYRSAHICPIDPDSQGVSDPRTGRCDRAASVPLALCIAALKTNRQGA